MSISLMLVKKNNKTIKTTINDNYDNKGENKLL